MGIQVHVDAEGQLSMTFEGQSWAQVKALAVDYVPDIDERVAAFTANFLGNRSSDAGLDPGDPGYSDTGDRTSGPRVSETAARAEDPGSGEPSGALDSGERLAEENEEGVDGEAGVRKCDVCSTKVPPDFADLMVNKHGVPLCPAHGTW